MGLSGNLGAFRILWNFDQIMPTTQLYCVSKSEILNCPIGSPCLLSHRRSSWHCLVEVQTQSPRGKQIIFCQRVDR